MGTAVIHLEVRATPKKNSLKSQKQSLEHKYERNWIICTMTLFLWPFEVVEVIFSKWHFDCSNTLDLIKTSFLKVVPIFHCLNILFWPFTVHINCLSDLKHFANSRPSALNFQKFFSVDYKNIFSHRPRNTFQNKILFLVNSAKSNLKQILCVQPPNC